MQSTDPWMSEVDLRAGQVWFNEVADKLAVSAFAVLCVTPENVAKPWLNFEAGAIGMTSRNGVRRAAAPYLFGFEDQDVLPTPLGMFEVKRANREGTLDLVTAINFDLPSPLSDPDLAEIFDMWWPQLETRLLDIPETAEDPAPTVEPDDNQSLMQEMLSILRRIDGEHGQRFRLDDPSPMDAPDAIRMADAYLLSYGVRADQASISVSTAGRTMTIELAENAKPDRPLDVIGPNIAKAVGLEVRIFR